MIYEQAFHVLMGLAAWILFWKLCWKRYALDKFRQDIFSTRNRLFELAHKDPDGFSFDHVVYNQLWDQMNGLIHFGYLMSPDFIVLNRLLLKLKFDGRTGNAVLNEMGQIDIDSVTSREARKALFGLKRNMSLSIFRYLATTSPLFLVYVLSVCFLAIVQDVHSLAVLGVKKLAEAGMHPALEYIGRQAIEIGKMKQSGVLA